MKLQTSNMKQKFNGGQSTNIVTISLHSSECY